MNLATRSSGGLAPLEQFSPITAFCWRYRKQHRLFAAHTEQSIPLR
jgi:hypothetical protein